MRITRLDRYTFGGLACVAVLLLTAGGGNASSPLAALSDDFSTATRIDEWHVTQGDVQAGPPARFGVGDGELTIVSSYSWWVDQSRAFALSKTLTGDFSVTVRLRASGRHSALPRAN